VARHAGATVYAVLLAEPLSPAALAPVARRLGAAGADKVLVGEAPGFDAPALDATHGAALHAIAERIAPMIVLFPAGGPGPELGAPLAMRLSGAFGGCSDLVLNQETGALPDGTGRVMLRRWRGGWSGCRLLDAVEIERPVVAILGLTGTGAGSGADAGDEEVEVEIVTFPAPRPAAIEELASEPDELAALELAATLVLIDGGARPAAARALAAAASPALAVVDVSRVRPAALAHAAPAAALHVGEPPPFTFGSPAMRIGVVAADGRAAARTADVIWTGPPTDESAGWAELARALAGPDDQEPEPS